MLKRFENLGTALSRNEAKKVVGGVDEYEDVLDEGGNGCCAHNADWSWSYCGENMTLSEARDWATDRAIQTGQHHYYCCASC